MAVVPFLGTRDVSAWDRPGSCPYGVYTLCGAPAVGTATLLATQGETEIQELRPSRR